ncbi:MAG: aminomethyl-transferring glycine dehydrogenase subunit GcvPB [Chloroflexi bacterium]|nr:aminomethyl-transferring glycine dehydrogenase subunit GcvPB [Chloroflexota bacterium]
MSIASDKPEPLIYELSSPDRTGAALPKCDVPTTQLPDKLMRKELRLPEVSEVDVVRHFTRLSQKNYCVDLGIYPLGSCTMKYNPKMNEEAVKLRGLAQIHPYQDADSVQGALQLMYELQEYLGAISGLPGVTLQPAAGAQGELTGVLVIRAYHRSRGDLKRVKVLVPDSAHGTNPATSSMSGFQVVQVKSDRRGNVDLDDLRRLADEQTVCMMVTNPNTLGLFEENVEEVCRIVHDAGGLVYGDGANLNAIVGVARPGDLGFDVMHSNLHKTFSVPHGGGGPGAGPVMVRKDLAQFLPGPIAAKKGAGAKAHYELSMPKKSVGRVKSFYGNFLALVRAYVYIRSFGKEHLREIAENSVVNANYLLARLKNTYSAPYGDRRCKHEFVLTGTPFVEQHGVHTLDIAKRIEDYGFYPPTIYFPLIVPECIMIEPTETQSRESLDEFADALLKIAEEARTAPELLHDAPHNAPVSRLDDVKAAREPVLCYKG